MKHERPPREDLGRITKWALGRAWAWRRAKRGHLARVVEWDDVAQEVRLLVWHIWETWEPGQFTFLGVLERRIRWHLYRWSVAWAGLPANLGNNASRLQQAIAITEGELRDSALSMPGDLGAYDAEMVRREELAGVWDLVQAELSPLRAAAVAAHALGHSDQRLADRDGVSRQAIHMRRLAALRLLREKIELPSYILAVWTEEQPRLWPHPHP